MSSRYVLVEDKDQLEGYFNAGMLWWRYRQGDPEYNEEYQQRDFARFWEEWVSRDINGWDSYVLVEEDVSPTDEDEDNSDG